jgi:hypothetical protein
MMVGWQAGSVEFGNFVVRGKLSSYGSMGHGSMGHGVQRAREYSTSLLTCTDI